MTEQDDDWVLTAPAWILMVPPGTANGSNRLFTIDGWFNSLSDTLRRKYFYFLNTILFIYKPSTAFLNQESTLSSL